MLNHSLKSTINAKSVSILGHTTSGMGERTLALKFKTACEKAGFKTAPIVDIIELMGEDYEPLAQMNYALADNGFDLIEDLKKLSLQSSADLLLILSWSFSVAALFATGIHRRYHTAVKLMVHHPNEKVLTKLYEPANVILTGSPLATQRAITYGIPPSKLLLLPHAFPSVCTHLPPSQEYAKKLARLQKKIIGSKTKIIGCVSRFEYGKNCEFAIEAVRRLVYQGHDLILILKGDFPNDSPYPDYKPLLAKMLQTYQHEKWLLWDPKPTPFPQVMEEYASFDVLLHPSGAEDGAQVVVECLGLKKPVIVLDCSTNPSLFNGLATFVKTTELREALLPFFIPDMEDLCQAIISDLPPPDFKKVQERFHEKVLEQRMSLLFEPNTEKMLHLHEEDQQTFNSK